MGKRIIIICSIVLVLAVFGFGQKQSRTMIVADGKLACPQDPSRNCIVYKESESSDWMYLDSAIGGFEFREGFTQTIRVSTIGTKHVLQKTLSAVKTDGKTAAAAKAFFESKIPPVLAGRNWTLVSMDAKPVAVPDVVLRFDRNSKRFGIRICNQIGGNFDQSGFDLKLTSVVATQMACRDPQSSVESRFVELLPIITRAQTAEGRLYLFAGKEKVLEFVERVALEDIRWAIVEIDGKPVVTSGDVPYLMLQRPGSALSGFTGCNQLFGKFLRNGDKLTFSEIAMTKMACTEDDMMGVEIGIMESLEKIDRFEIRNGVLMLFVGSRLRLKLIVMPN